MEFEKILNLSDEELRTQQAKSAEQLFRLRFQKSLGNNEGIKKLRGLKLDIARIKTVARQRELASNNGTSPTSVASAVKAPKKAQAKTAAGSAKPSAGARSKTGAKAATRSAAFSLSKAKKG